MKKIKQIKSCYMAEQPELINEVYVGEEIFANIKHLTNYDKVKMLKYFKRIGITDFSEDNNLEVSTGMIEWGIENLITEWGAGDISLSTFELLNDEYQTAIMEGISKVIVEGMTVKEEISKN